MFNLGKFIKLYTLFWIDITYFNKKLFFKTAVLLNFILLKTTYLLTLLEVVLFKFFFIRLYSIALSNTQFVFLAYEKKRAIQNILWNQKVFFNSFINPWDLKISKGKKTYFLTSMCSFYSHHYLIRELLWHTCGRLFSKDSHSNTYPNPSCFC